MKMTTAKAHKAPAKIHHKKHKIAGIHIMPSSNGGFSVAHDMPRPDPSNANPYPSAPQQDPAVFADQAGAHAHVGQLMGQMGGEQEPDADDKVAA